MIPGWIKDALGGLPPLHDGYAESGAEVPYIVVRQTAASSPLDSLRGTELIGSASWSVYAVANSADASAALGSEVRRRLHGTWSGHTTATATLAYAGAHVSGVYETLVTTQTQEGALAALTLAPKAPPSLTSVPAGGDITLALQAALDGASPVVEVPAGTWQCGPLSLAKAHGKRLLGDGATLVAKPGISAPLLTAPSGAKLDGFLVRDLTIDMAWRPGQPAVNAVQITNASSCTFDGVTIRNVGKAGIVAQGHGPAGSGCPGLTVTDCLIQRCGLEDKTTGFGILVQGQSPNARISGNRVEDVKGGMGIGGNRTAQGAPVGMLILGNTIRMQRSSTAFEAIGITLGCDYATITGNIVSDSYDNGVSSSAAFTTVSGNTIQRCWNHGIAFEGTHSTCVGNVISDIGRQNAELGEDLKYGRVTFQNPSYCVATGNTGSGEAAHNVKINGTKGPGCYFGGNSWDV